MKKDIHPDYVETKVKCNGCDTTFTTRSTVPEITVEICSNCHPFYTGKQKLVDVAGRVDRFKARQAAAKDKPLKKSKKSLTSEAKKAAPKSADLSELKAKISEQNTSPVSK